MRQLGCERLAVVGLAASGRCELPLTQVDLADATGLTPVHVNRTLQELRRMELIELANKQLYVPDLASLRTTARLRSLNSATADPDPPIPTPIRSLAPNPAPSASQSRRARPVLSKAAGATSRSSAVEGPLTLQANGSRLHAE